METKYFLCVNVQRWNHALQGIPTLETRSTKPAEISFGSELQLVTLLLNINNVDVVGLFRVAAPVMRHITISS